jgi:hypothetical protein
MIWGSSRGRHAHGVEARSRRTRLRSIGIAAVGSALLGAGLVVATAVPAAAAPPGAPTLKSVKAGPGVGEMTIKWAPNASDGGSPVTSFEYEYAVDSGSWVAGSTTFGAAARSAVVPCPATLAPTHGCSFHVRANNGAPSAWSNSKSSVWKKPSAPILLSTLAGPAVGEARLKWRPAKNTGGLPLLATRYAVNVGSGFGAAITIDPGDITTVQTTPHVILSTIVPCSITTIGGPAGCKYRMYATNAVGTSVASTASTAKLSKPGTVRSLTAGTTSVALGTGDATQSISWDEPASTGGLAITKTTLFACSTAAGSVCKDFSPDWELVANYTGSPASVSTTHVCPENGRCAYNVQATNALGRSIVVAYSRPAPAQNLTATPSTVTAGAVNLTWTGTVDPGSSFGNYVLFECSVANDCTQGDWTNVPADAAPWVATNLVGPTTSTSYACGITTACEFRVGYVGGSGNIGHVSNAVTAVGLDAPSLTATANASPGTIDLSWSPPSTFATITGYKIERDLGSGFSHLVTVGASPTSYSDTTCPSTTSCGYRVTAIFVVGTSARSAPQYATAN